jgi:hypothetical protein
MTFWSLDQKYNEPQIVLHLFSVGLWTNQIKSSVLCLLQEGRQDTRRHEHAASNCNKRVHCWEAGTVIGRCIRGSRGISWRWSLGGTSGVRTWNDTIDAMKDTFIPNNVSISSVHGNCNIVL